MIAHYCAAEVGLGTWFVWMKEKEKEQEPEQKEEQEQKY